MEALLASSDLDRLFECPVCLDNLRPPIRLCTSGHSICQDCTSRLDLCPLCRAKFSDITPIAFNQVLEAIPRRCRFEKSGCKVLFRLGDAHEEFCAYRPTCCRLSECQWQGPLRSLLPHLRKEHGPPELISVGCGHVFELKILNPEKDFKTFKPIAIQGESLVWQIIELDVSRKLLLLSLYLLPEHPSTKPLMAELTLESGSLRYSFSAPVCSKDVGDDDVHSLKNLMLVPQSALIDLLRANNEPILRIRFSQTEINEEVVSRESNEDGEEIESEGALRREHPLVCYDVVEDSFEYDYLY